MPILNHADLRADLVRGGLRPGTIVMVHSALSKLGNVEGGPATVIQAIIDAISPDGTLLMPTYNSADLAIRMSQEDNCVDLRTLPSNSGMITEVFRRRADVIRSSHPFSPVCAWGAEAVYMTAGHAEDPRVCHSESPIGRLVKRGGIVLGIGVNLGPGMGVAHCLEDTWDDFPKKVHAPPVRVQYRDASGMLISRMIIRYDPDTLRTRIDQPGGAWICNAMTSHLMRVGILKIFPCGKTAAWIANAAALYQELKRLAARGITIYSTEEQISSAGVDAW